MISAFALSQILAAIAFVFGLVGYQFKERKLTVSSFGLAHVFNSAHFFLLGATIGGLVLAFSALRFFMSIWTTHVGVKYVFISGVLLIGVWMYEVPYDVLPVVASIFGTLGAFESRNHRMRQYFIGGSLSILIYNVLIWSPVATLAGVFFLGSALVGYWRFCLRTGHG